MAETQLVARNFDLGFRSDISRDQLDKGIADRLKDWIPQNEAPLRKRGGFQWATVDLNGLSSTGRVAALGWAPFPSDPHLIAIGNNGKVFRSQTTSGSGGIFVEDVPHLVEMTYPPFWHRDRMILPIGYGQTAQNPKKYVVAAPYDVADVGGTPPQAVAGCSWGDYLAFANGTVSAVRFPNRIWWSAVGNPDSFTTSTSFFDMPDEVVALMLLRNITLVWGFERCWILTGDTPPPGGNLARRDFANTGTFDARSIARYRDYAIWANASGVWRSDGGTSPVDLCEQGGISLFYQSLVSNFNYGQGWKAAGGVYRGQYFLTITDNNGATLTTLVCDIDRAVWYEFTNIKAAMYATRSAGPGTASEAGDEELLFGHRATPRVVRCSDLWTPTSANANDADGIAVLPSIETPYYQLGGAESKRIRRAYVSYSAVSAGAEPEIRVLGVFTPESTDYISLDPALGPTNGKKRRRVEIRRRSQGVGLKIQQMVPTADTRLYEIELEGHEMEASHATA